MENYTVYATLGIKAVGEGTSPEEVLEKAVENRDYEILEKKIDSRPVDNYISLAEFAVQNNLSNGIYLRKLCQQGKLPGAVKMGRNWFVPKDTPYIDRRFKSGGVYSEWRQLSGKERWEVMKAQKNNAREQGSLDKDFTPALEECDNITSRP